MFKTIEYKNLNAKQKENYNFHQIGAKLAEYGYHSMWLGDDWEGADFIAIHIDGNSFLKIQLKGRLSLDKKYIGKSIHIAFCQDNRWYIYPHDEIKKVIIDLGLIAKTKSWKQKGLYNWPKIPEKLIPLLSKYAV